MADVEAIFQAFEALDDARLEHNLLDPKSQATNREDLCFKDWTGRVRIEGFH